MFKKFLAFKRRFYLLIYGDFNPYPKNIENFSYNPSEFINHAAENKISSSEVEIVEIKSEIRDFDKRLLELNKQIRIAPNQAKKLESLNQKYMKLRDNCELKLKETREEKIAERVAYMQQSEKNVDNLN